MAECGRRLPDNVDRRPHVHRGDYQPDGQVGPPGTRGKDAHRRYQDAHVGYDVVARAQPGGTP